MEKGPTKKNTPKSFSAIGKELCSVKIQSGGTIMAAAQGDSWYSEPSIGGAENAVGAKCFQLPAGMEKEFGQTQNGFSSGGPGNNFESWMELGWRKVRRLGLDGKNPDFPTKPCQSEGLLMAQYGDATQGRGIFRSENQDTWLVRRRLHRGDGTQTRAAPSSWMVTRLLGTMETGCVKHLYLVPGARMNDHGRKIGLTTESGATVRDFARLQGA